MVKKTLFEIPYFKDHIQKTKAVFEEKYPVTIEVTKEGDTEIELAFTSAGETNAYETVSFQMKRDKDNPTDVEITTQKIEGTSFAKELAKATPALLGSVLLGILVALIFRFAFQIPNFQIPLASGVFVILFYLVKRFVFGDKSHRLTRKFIRELF